MVGKTSFIIRVDSMENKKNGVFIVSLDFELLWGMHDCENPESFYNDVIGARNGIKKMLSIFEEYGICATWGVVGLLMAKNREDVCKYSPEIKPEYEKQDLSAYNYFDTLGEDEKEDICHYAYSLVAEILKYKNQEIASHTFSHYYCNAKGQTEESFASDLNAAQKIAKEKFGLELKSLILPRNDFNVNYLETIRKCGFLSVRGNPKHYAYNNENFLAKCMRMIDTYIGICGKKTYVPKYNGGVINLKASMFYRRYNPKISFLEPLKIKYIKRQMKKAAQNREYFHLWWHPHNIGKYTEKSLKQLEDLFSYYRELNSVYGFQCKTMREMSEEIINENSDAMQ